MKKLLLLTCLSFVFSCTKNEETELKTTSFNKATSEIVEKYTEKKSILTNLSKLAGPCDNAASVGYSYEYDFEFHRPIYNCESGFWFCGTSHHYMQCLDANGNVIYQEEIFDGSEKLQQNINKKHKYKIDVKILTNNEAMYAFPKNQLLSEGYKVKDLKVFNVDENIEVFKNSNIYLVKGNYEVFEYQNKLLILLKTYTK